jgi:regulator of replication initiation timing
MTTQTEAQRLAALIQGRPDNAIIYGDAAAAELRRLEADFSQLMQKHNALHINARAGRDRIAELEAENARMRSELDRPMSSEATVLVHDNARLRAEVQALHKSLADSVLHAKTGWERYESANRMRNQVLSELEALRGAVPAVPDAIEVTADNDAAYGYQDGWNACRKAMLAAAPQPAAQADPFTYVIQHLNSSPYALTKDECITKIKELRAIYKAQGEKQ